MLVLFLILEGVVCSFMVWVIPQTMRLLGQHTPPFVRDLRFEVDLAFGVFVAAVLVRRLGPWPRLADAFVDAQEIWHVAVGALGVLAVFCTIKLVVDHNGLHSFAPINHYFPVVFALLLALCAAVVEECAYRGYVLPFLEQNYGTFTGVIGSALVFGGVHVFNGYPYTPFNCLLIALTNGLLFSAAFVLTRHLYLSIGLHWGYDIASFLLLGNIHFHPLYHLHSAQTILTLLNIADMYIGLLFLYLAYKRGRLRLSAKSETVLRLLLSPGFLLPLQRNPQRRKRKSL